jgi:hypothetical protein
VPLGPDGYVGGSRFESVKQPAQVSIDEAPEVAEWVLAYAATQYQPLPKTR